MRAISISEKTGFFTPAGCKIYDARGLFLEYEKATNFNLPAGKYTLKSGIVSASPSPVVYQDITLPPKEKHIDWEDRHVTIGPGWETSKIAIDAQMLSIIYNPDWIKDLTTPEYEFAVRHELGHIFYFSQANCDMFAAKSMLEDGFNPAQIAQACHDTLCGDCSKFELAFKNLFNLDLNLPPESADRRMTMDTAMLENSKLTKAFNSITL